MRVELLTFVCESERVKGRRIPPFLLSILHILILTINCRIQLFTIRVRIGLTVCATSSEIRVVFAGTSIDVLDKMRHLQEAFCTS